MLPKTPDPERFKDIYDIGEPAISLVTHLALFQVNLTFQKALDATLLAQLLPAYAM